MQLDLLHISNLRCITSCNVEFADGIHCIVGDNASGKTSFLEAIHVLGRGTSFRQARLAKTIRNGESELVLRSKFGEPNEVRKNVGCIIKRNKYQFKLDGQTDVKRLDLVRSLPLQHIGPNVHRLIEQGPKYRRHFLDWGVFHVEHAFFPAWRRYRRALRQRNQALRGRQAKEQIVAWDAELIEQGEIINACRCSYLERIEKKLPDMVHRLTGEQQLTFGYMPGWRGDDGYGLALARAFNQDVRAGFTQQGPHRADFRVEFSSISAKDWVSRGQEKMLAIALLLAQASILKEVVGIHPILLVDDLAAELGYSFRNLLGQEIGVLGLQSFLTFLEVEHVPDNLQGGRMFHVEQGKIKQF